MEIYCAVDSTNPWKQRLWGPCTVYCTVFRNKIW